MFGMKLVVLVTEPTPCCVQKFARALNAVGCGARHAARLCEGHLWALGRGCGGARRVQAKHARV